MTVTHTVEVEAPPERVYAFLLDFENRPQWAPNVRSVEPLTDRQGEVGARYREVVDPFPPLPRTTSTFEVTAAQPPSRLEIVSEMMGQQGSLVYDLAPTATGTHLTLTAEADVPGPLALMARRLRKHFEAAVDEGLANMKRMLEKV